MQENFKEYFFQSLHEWGLKLDEIHYCQLLKYWSLIDLWNKAINLVSVKDRMDFFFSHILDSLAPLPFFPSHDTSLLDLGTGAGLPGIPIKILRPNFKLTLIEASRRRTSFLREVIRQLQLKNVTLINDRVEHVIKKEELIFDNIITRATWKLFPYLSIADPLLAPGGLAVALKGQIPPDEWSEAMKFIENKRYSLITDYSYFLPTSRRKRRVLIFKKHNDI
ncbi:MAG: 16S rRNA (guanine(527)-N(7))-methyltransferase RsmG [Syntrophales bacterium]|nr:16S rRNA (guanine(527)-N(7))-methyltransferase RsmG [Syntrophales bacterium]